MKKFEFSMEKILEIREFKKQQAQMELGKAVAEETKIQETLDMIAKQRLETMKSTQGVTDFRWLNDANRHLNFLDQKTEELLKQLAEAKLVTEQKREVMREAMKKVTVLEKVKDARKEEWASEAKKAEEKENDDSANSRYNK